MKKFQSEKNNLNHSLLLHLNKLAPIFKSKVKEKKKVIIVKKKVTIIKKKTGDFSKEQFEKIEEPLEKITIKKR